MPLELLKGYRNRDLAEDQWELVLAIKESSDRTLYQRFQDYWMKRCLNPEYLSDYDTWSVLHGYITDMFDRSDWYNIKDSIRREYFKKRALTARDMVDIYLSAIQLMQVRYKIKPENKTRWCAFSGAWNCPLRNEEDTYCKESLDMGYCAKKHST